MKKCIAIAIAVLLLAVSVLPAFAENIDSPHATKANYIVEVEEEEGGHVDVDYKTGVDDDGNQTIVITAVPKDGYTFAGWIINGSYTTNGSLSDAVLELIISGDISVRATYSKNAEGSTSPSETPTQAPTESRVVDDSTKSPQTGSADFAPYVVLVLSAAALIAVIATAKRRKADK